MVGAVRGAAPDQVDLAHLATATPCACSGAGHRARPVAEAAFSLDVEVVPDRGEGCPELVECVGEELAQALARAVALVDHDVEDVGELAGFRCGCWRRGREPVPCMTPHVEVLRCPLSLAVIGGPSVTAPGAATSVLRLGVSSRSRPCSTGVSSPSST